MHSRITFYVYAKIGQVNGGGGRPPSPLDPPLVTCDYMTEQGDRRESYMDQILDAGRAGDKANKIRQHPCQGHAVQFLCSAVTRLSRLEAGYSDCEL